MEITGDHYYQAIKYSRLLLKKYKENLNKINVFPVSDGDTGNNLFLTIDGIWKKIKNNKIKHFGKFSEYVAEAALESAVGNSGNILASFLYGIYDYSKDKEILKPEELIYAFERGTDFAYQAVENPKEGTILTAMRATVETAKKEIEKGNRNLTDILKKCVDVALKELKEKRIYIPELVNYDVIDAGGLGFILIIKSWTRGLKDEFLLKLTSKEIKINYSGKYCVNILLKLEDPNRIEKLKNKLKEIGNSIIVTKFQDKIKIHIHSADIQLLKSILTRYGNIIKFSVSPI